ncbi:c-type cytochrome [Cognatilysobacter lacus]|nr:c-type cytochrome [Lysobacter lacus]
MVVLAYAGAANAVDPATLARSGGAGVAACSSCHGDKGQGQGNFPRLAAQHSAYLARQLEDFASGRRDNPIMSPIAKALSAPDRAAMANYYGALPAPAPLAAAPAPATAPGGWLATRGAWSKGVPGCVQCHGPGGRGVGAAFPSIAGQPAGYIAAQLTAFASGARRNDPQALMRTPAAKLSQSEIDSVSQWLSTQPAAAAGASR